MFHAVTACTQPTQTRTHTIPQGS